MRLSDRRWRVVSVLPVIAGTLLTMGETALASSGPAPTIAGIQLGVIGIALIGLGAALFIVSQRAASAADASSEPPRR